MSNEETKEGAVASPATEPTAAQTLNLGKYDYCLLIDKSGSMNTNDCPGGKSRWEFTKENTVNIARVCSKFDSDGIQVRVFAGNFKTYDNVTPEQVEKIFTENEPANSTDTAKVLEAVLSDYRTRYDADPVNCKPLIVVCITDGAPDDQDAVAKSIVNHTKWMKEDGQTGITFLQVGGDSGARKFLTYLDDNLVSKEGAAFDIVDTKDQSEMDNLNPTELLIAAIED